MWSKLAKLASPAPRNTSTASSKSSSNPANESNFLNTVDQLRTTLATSEADGKAAGGARDRVSQLLDELLRFLVAEQQTASSSSLVGACVEVLLRDAVLEELVEMVREDESGIREELVRWYGRAIVELEEGWLGHSAVNKPLVKLLRRCVDEDGGLMRSEELAVVEVMCIVTERIKTRSELLAIFFREKSGARRPKKDLSASIAPAVNRPVPLTAMSSPSVDGRPSSPTFSQASTSEASTSFSAALSQTSTTSPYGARRADHDFLLFSYLLRFIHREGEVGDFAREGILSLVDVAFSYPELYTPSFAHQRTTPSSTSSPSSAQLAAPTHSPAAREAVLTFAEYLLDSDFAEVLGAGLGALYGLLPSKLVVRTGAATTDCVATPQDGVGIEGGMVLGGMGPLQLEEGDADEAKRRKEEEERRLRSEGYGISGTGDFREGLDGFLKLVEFTQEILRRSESQLDDGLEDDEESTGAQQKLVKSQLTGAVLSAVRSLFLQSVLYPSILECSEGDGSAVAVLSYLDAFFEVVQEGTKLEATLLGFLLAEDDANHLSPHLRAKQRPSNASALSSPSQQFLSPQPSSTPKHKRGKSSALLLLERAAPSPSARAANDYFTSLGRFSLRDLLVGHLSSSSQPTAAAALRLLQTLLKQHDRWSLALLDVTPDNGATAFPVALREPPAVILEDSDSEDDEAEFVYNSKQTVDDSSDDEQFIYPSSDSPITPRAPSRPSIPSASSFPHTPAPVHARLLGAPLPSAPSVSAHLDSLDTLLSLVSTIDPSYRRKRAMGAAHGSELLNTGFSNYLRDAEAALANDVGFRRGLTAAPEEAEQFPAASSRRRTGLFGVPATRISGRVFAAAPAGTRHMLRPSSSKVTALLLESLAAFFSHSPETNLALTAVLTALASCPYRGLEGWLLPAVNSPKQEDEDGYEKDGSDDGDDRSVDFDVDERARHDALLSPLPSRDPSSLSPDAPPSATRQALVTPQGATTVLAILDALAKSVEEYRRAIPEFDKFLVERRQGLFFAENLAEALGGQGELTSAGGGGIEENAFGLPMPPPPKPAPPISEPPKKPSSSLGLGAFFSPRRPSHDRTPALSHTDAAFSTPTKQPHAPSRPSQLRRSASEESLVPSSPPVSRSSAPSLAPPLPSASAATKNGPASPFAAHYRQTGAITVQPVVVSTPLSTRRASSRAADGEDDEAEDREEREEGGFDSPTKRLSTPAASSTSAAQSPRSSSPSARSSASSAFTSVAGGGDSSSRSPRKPPAQVSLSMVLDNCILLEEFVKELAAVVYVRRAVGVDAVKVL
ncbi:hypothetical protein JCM11641_002954 [Rhodosporidiobolus odoratus]